MTLRATGFVFGLLFGFIIAWAGLTSYDVIHDMLLLQHPDVFLLMVSAVLTAAIGIRLLRCGHVRSVLDKRLVECTVHRVERRHILGSAIFGLGWSIAGTCPGPVAVQLGRGQLAAVFTIAGILVGIALRDRLALRSTSGIGSTVQSTTEEIVPAVGL